MHAIYISLSLCCHTGCVKCGKRKAMPLAIRSCIHLLLFCPRSFHSLILASNCICYPLSSASHWIASQPPSYDSTAQNQATNVQRISSSEINNVFSYQHIMNLYLIQSISLIHMHLQNEWHVYTFPPDIYSSHSKLPVHYSSCLTSNVVPFVFRWKKFCSFMMWNLWHPALLWNVTQRPAL